MDTLNWLIHLTVASSSLGSTLFNRSRIDNPIAFDLSHKLSLILMELVEQLLSP
jgi:hypothetical protein